MDGALLVTHRTIKNAVKPPFRGGTRDGHVGPFGYDCVRSWVSGDNSYGDCVHNKAVKKEKDDLHSVNLITAQSLIMESRSTLHHAHITRNEEG